MSLKKFMDGLLHRNVQQENLPESKNMIDFKKYVEEKINEAKANLIFHDSIPALYFVKSNEKAVEYSILFDEEHKDAEVLRMKELCKGAQASAFLFDSFINSCTEEEADQITDGLEDKKGTMSAITIFIYTPEQVCSRALIYTRKGPQDYLFADKGWENTDSPGGRLANPFIDIV